MNREQLAHVLRAAARIVDDPEIVVVGSQAILGAFDADELPDETTFSMEVDVAFWDDPDHSKADQVDGAIGEGSDFHESFGYYGQGVETATAVLPAGWRDRVVPFDRLDAEPSTAVCVEPHDLVVSKLVAGREKDLRFARALIRAGTIERPAAVRERVRRYVRRCAGEGSTA